MCDMQYAVDPYARGCAGRKGKGVGSLVLQDQKWSWGGGGERGRRQNKLLAGGIKKDGGMLLLGCTALL